MNDVGREAERAPRVTTAYDEVPYPGLPHTETHLDHLAVIGKLHGMAPVPPERCRVLEIGCGDGANLIPMADQYPQSEFLGIDLSERAIARGRADAAELALQNIALRHRDILEVSARDGQFDYIIAHGIYSWVPHAVRDKILSIFAQNLTPAGIAYVSYNAYPGAHLNNLVCSMLLYHTRDVSDPAARTAQARKLMDILAEASAENTVYGAVLRDRAMQMRQGPDHLLIHDDLAPSTTAFFLYEVLEAAAVHGLQYVADASFVSATVSERARSMLDAIPEQNVAVRDQYLDFVQGREFHRTVFSHKNIPLRRPIPSAAVRDLYLSSRAAPTGEFDPAAPGVIEFRMDNRTLRTDHRLAKAALLLLGKAWPQAIAFADLAAQASSLVATPATPVPDADVDNLAEIMLRSFIAGHLHLHYRPPPLTTSVVERPLASRYARWQARRKNLLTTLRHDLIYLVDKTAWRLLLLCDGSRTVDELARDLKSWPAGGGDIPEPAGLEPNGDASAQITRETVQAALGRLAKIALLVRSASPPA